MRNLNAGTVLAFIALFVALGGGAYAAITLPKNSVTTRQVKDRSLLAKDFKKGQIPRGEQGPEGAVGPQGPPGPVTVATLTKVKGNSQTVCAAGTTCAVASSVATCPTGSKVITGGFFNYSGTTEGEYSDASEDRTAWTAGVANGSSYSGGSVQAFAYCSPTGAAVVSSRRPATAQTRRDVAARERALRRMSRRR